VEKRRATTGAPPPEGDPGILAASGLVAGEGLAGVLVAGLVAAGLAPRAMASRAGGVPGTVLTVAALIAVCGFLANAARRRPVPAREA
jgi:hypothetical protein